MSNTVITNYTDLNGPSTKADSSVVVIVNKDGSLSVDENLLGTLMGSDGSQAAGISVVRVGHEGRPDDATDSESDDDQVPHVTLSVDSYFDDPNSIIKYDSGAEMLQSFRIETRENSLLGFQNDHCYTLMSPDGSSQQKSEGYSGYDEPIIEISQQPPPKPVPNSKKITILEQKIIPKGRKLPVNSSEAYVLKGNEALHKSLGRSKIESRADKILAEVRKDENSESSSMSSSGDSIPDRDSDSDYNYVREKPGSMKKGKLKPKILKAVPAKGGKLDPKAAARLKSNKNILRKEIKDKISGKMVLERDFKGSSAVSSSAGDQKKETPKQVVKIIRKEKKTPAHVNALLTDMTALFSTPDVIRRISTENKTPSSKDSAGGKKIDDAKDKLQRTAKHKSLLEKGGKGYDLIPQIDDASLAQILQDTTPSKTAVTTANSMNSPGLAGPLSPTLDLLGGLQPEEEGLTEDLLMHVAQLVESSENLQEVIDKQVLGKVDTTPKAASSAFQQGSDTMYTPSKSVKTVLPRKDPIEIVRRDGRVITLPPIEAPATRSSKRKSQLESASGPDAAPTPAPAAAAAPAPATAISPAIATPSQAQRDFEAELELSAHIISKQYINKKIPKKVDQAEAAPAVDKASAESQESWNSEDDPNRLWCICRQPHNNRFMICCDGCEDWFHGKCVNITKVMGQQMEERGVEWRCPNCVRKVKTPKTMQQKLSPFVKKRESIGEGSSTPSSSEARQGAPGAQGGPGGAGGGRGGCIVCARAARPASIYCSDACIQKHAQDSAAAIATPEPGKPEKKMESRVIVYERKSGKCLAGPTAPTAENLKAWLQQNPTFEVVRPGQLHAMRPVKKTPEPGKVQTTLNFNRVPKKIPIGQSLLTKSSPTVKESQKVVTPESKPTPSPRTPVTPKAIQKTFFDTPKASTSAARPSPSEVRKPARPPPARPQPSTSKASAGPGPGPGPAASRRKDTPDSRSRLGAVEPIRENVRKALQEQLGLRMAETSGPKFSDKEVQDFATDTEAELYDLFKDVGVKYKAKYRSLMFNIKDRKNLTLWDKICDKSISPRQLVRLSAEELASQELAQWRDQEAKHQLELIKKSELDLLAASKTYVLKTHKGEEVMETKESVSTELDPNVAVEDLVSALNDSTGGEPDSTEAEPGKSPRKLSVDSSEKQISKKKKEESESRSRRSTRESKRDADSRRARRRSPSKPREESSRRSDRKSKEKARSPSKDRTKKVEKADSSERSSRSKTSRSSKSHSRSQERERERDRSRSRGRSKRESRDSRSSRRNRSKQRESADDPKQRSRSQEATTPKGKNESTDFEAIERPKSAMMKESHPEYDPHEPMITSALSDEDLKKAGDDEYGDTLLDIDLAATGYDPTKPFTIDTTTKSSPKSTKSAKRKLDKVSEAESDQEPSSTVEHAAPTVWNGCINMVDVARFYVAAHEVSGCGADLEEDLAAELDVVGRIHPETVWDYLLKMKRSGTRDVCVLRLRAANDEEQMQYIALYSYLSSRSRLGVIKVSKSTNVKDFYIIPLAANEPLPPVLLPLDGPGLEDSRNHLLIGVVIRQRKAKRPPPHLPQEIVPAKMTRSGRKRSFTPPQPAPLPQPLALPLPGPPYSSPALSNTVKDKIAASLASQDDEPYSPGSGSVSGGSGSGSEGARPRSDRLRTKMEELNRQIEEQKQQIRKMKQVAPAAANDEDEAYSPSRPMTPPSPGLSQSPVPAPPAVPLADIALPSNLQEILASIKQRSGAAGVAAPAPADVDMRTSNT